MGGKMIRANDLKRVAVITIYEGRAIVATTLPKGAVDVYIDGDHATYCKMTVSSGGFVRNNSDLSYSGLKDDRKMIPQEVLDDIFDMIEYKCKTVS
jgi:hypothetical protein